MNWQLLIESMDCTSADFVVKFVHDESTIRAACQSMHAALVVLCIRGTDVDSELRLLGGLRGYNKQVPIILVTHRSSERLLLAALRMSIIDYFDAASLESEFVDSIRQGVPFLQSRDLLGCNEPTVIRSQSRGMIRDSDSIRFINRSPLLGQYIRLYGANHRRNGYRKRSRYRADSLQLSSQKQTTCFNKLCCNSVKFD